MFKNKLVMMMVIVLIGICLIGGTAFGLWWFMFRTAEPVDPNAEAEQHVEAVEVEKVPIEEIIASTVELEEVTTTLKTGNFVKVQVALRFENADQKTAFGEASFLVNDILLRTLADTDVEELKGEQGIGNLASEIMNKINEELVEMKIVKVYIKSIMVQ